jgi:hypothetical protein
VTLLIAPTVAALGLIATVLVIRARYREKESLYETLRAERQKQIQQARRRAIGDSKATPPPPTPAVPAPAQAAAHSAPKTPVSGIAAIREEAIHRGRLRNVAGVTALVVSLAVVLLGVVLAIAEARAA